MRIGVYLGDFQPESGGAYTFVADIFSSFLRIAGESRHDFVVMCAPSACNAICRQPLPTNIKVVSVAMPGSLAKWIAGLKFFSPIFRWLWRRPGPIERKARNQQVELLWFLGVSANECPDIPYVATLWDLQHRQQPFFPEVSANEIWDKREQYYGYFLRRAAYCLTGTETGKREIIRFYQLANNRVRVFPLPTPEYAIQAPESTINVRRQWPITGNYVFYPAQFWAHKNHVNLILALKFMKEHRGLMLSLVLTGSDKGNLEFVKEVAAKEGMAEHILFPGFVPTSELIALYRNAMALVFVTYFGPDNIPPLEAFALGCPVIASSVDGAHEQYGDAALFVDPSSPESIGEAIWQLHSDANLRRKLTEAGLERAQKWTALDYVRGVFGLFDEFFAIRRNWLR